MQLTERQQAMRDGAMGKGVAMAMQIQCAVGESFEAERMVPVSRVHVSLSAQAADRWFAGKMLAAGAHCTVPPTVNPGFSTEYFRAKGMLTEDAAAVMEETERIYRGLGAVLTYSCTPYLSLNVPRFGEVCALSETSVTIYANAVTGARTNRESAASALCAAVTGLVPEYGMLLPENRKATVLVEVQAPMENIFDYSLLGLMGAEIGRGIPVFTGLPEHIPTEALIALGAQLNVSGSFDMYHIPGVTPEAPDLRTALGGAEPQRCVIVTAEAMRENLARYSCPVGAKIDYVILGCPHYTWEQLEQTAEALRREPAAVPVYILTSHANRGLAERMGLSGELTALGAELIADTCVDEACCWDFLVGKQGVTDSAKALYYMRSFGVTMAVRSRETCLRWAHRGEVCGDA